MDVNVFVPWLSGARPDVPQPSHCHAAHVPAGSHPGGAGRRRQRVCGGRRGHSTTRGGLIWSCGHCAHLGAAGCHTGRARETAGDAHAPWRAAGGMLARTRTIWATTSTVFELQACGLRWKQSTSVVSGKCCPRRCMPEQALRVHERALNGTSLSCSDKEGGSAERPFGFTSLYLANVPWDRAMIRPSQRWPTGGKLGHGAALCRPDGAGGDDGGAAGAGRGRARAGGHTPRMLINIVHSINEDTQ